MANLLFEIPIQIELNAKKGEYKEMAGAYVNCYSGAKDVKEALQKCVKKLSADGYIFKDILQEAQILDPDKWEEFVESAWPEVVDYFPTQKHVKSIVLNGQVFFGPFVAYSP